jgi:hypothetical protein
VLITSNRYEEMTAALMRPLVEDIPGDQHMMSEKSAHLAMAEGPNSVEASSSPFLVGRTRQHNEASGELRRWFLL